MNKKTPEERRVMAAKGVATRKANKQAADKLREDAITYRNGLKEEIEELESKLNSLKVEDDLSCLSLSLTTKTLLREEEIVNMSSPWERQAGVYFLISMGEVAYVGQSICVHSRINTHAGNHGHIGLCFTSCAWIACPVEKLDFLESLYIHLLRPPMNGNKPNGSKTAPFSLDELLRIKLPLEWGIRERANAK